MAKKKKMSELSVWISMLKTCLATDKNRSTWQLL